MRWLGPLLLLLAGCTAYASGPYTNVDTISLEQSRYLGKDALPPRGSPARFTEAQNCGTPDQWKACPRALRPSVRVYVDVASTSDAKAGTTPDSRAKSDGLTTQPLADQVSERVALPAGH
jgi:hypothetical protein